MIHRLVCCIIAACLSSIVFGRNAISLATGHGTSGVDACRVNLQHEWKVYLANGCPLRGYFELAGMRINNKHEFSTPTNSNTELVSLSPVIRFHPKFGLQWYVDLGIGLAYFTKHEIATRNLGSHVVFEDRAGLGALFGKTGQFELGYRAIHYSNAYLAKINQGINIHLFLIGYWF